MFLNVSNADASNATETHVTQGKWVNDGFRIVQSSNMQTIEVINAKQSACMHVYTYYDFGNIVYMVSFSCYMYRCI